MKIKLSRKRDSKPNLLKELNEDNTFYIQEVRHIKEEINVDTDESSAFEMSEYSNYENEADFYESSINDMSSIQSLNYEMKYHDQEISPSDVNNLVTLSDLIDFTCTKCRRTSKNPDYFLNKTDLQCPDCQATMKFQCPRCKLLFRQFDSACRHARQICQIDDDSERQQRQFPEGNQKQDNYVRNCSDCGFATSSSQEMRRHFKLEHPVSERSSTSKTNMCWRCGRQYKSRDSMLKHARLCGRAPHIVCEFCPYRTKRREHLRVHMRHKHPDPESCHGNTYDCPKCSKKYKYLMAMKSHMRQCGKWDEPLISGPVTQPLDERSAAQPPDEHRDSYPVLQPSDEHHD